MPTPAPHRFLLLYVIASIFLAYYISQVPIFLTGHWLNNLNPARITSANPLLFLVLGWVLIPHRYFVFTYFGISCVTMLIFNQLTGGWIGLDTVGKSGFGVFALLWLETILPAFVAPAILAYLLLKCEVFGPKMLRGWSESETKTV